MSTVSLAKWNRYIQSQPSIHLLQTGEWGELKAAFGWKPIRIVSETLGVQILFRKLPFGFTVGYIPKANFALSLWPEIDSVCKQNHAIFLKLERDAWQGENLPQITNYSLLIVVISIYVF